MNGPRVAALCILGIVMMAPYVAWMALRRFSPHLFLEVFYPRPRYHFFSGPMTFWEQWSQWILLAVFVFGLILLGVGFGISKRSTAPSIQS